MLRKKVCVCVCGGGGGMAPLAPPDSLALLLAWYLHCQVTFFFWSISWKRLPLYIEARSNGLNIDDLWKWNEMRLNLFHTMILHLSFHISCFYVWYLLLSIILQCVTGTNSRKLAKSDHLFLLCECWISIATINITVTNRYFNKQMHKKETKNLVLVKIRYLVSFSLV